MKNARPWLEGLVLRSELSGVEEKQSNDLLGFVQPKSNENIR